MAQVDREAWIENNTVSVLLLTQNVGAIEATGSTVSLDTQSTRKRVIFRVGFVCFGLNVFSLFGGMLGHVGPLLWMAAVHGLSNSRQHKR